MHDVPKHHDLDDFLFNVASYSVGCEPLPISSVFGRHVFDQVLSISFKSIMNYLDEKFYEKLDHFVPYKDDIEKLIEAAAELKVFDVYGYYQLSKGKCSNLRKLNDVSHF